MVAIIHFHMMMTVQLILKLALDVGMQGLFMTAPMKVAKSKKTRQLESVGLVHFVLHVVTRVEGVLMVVNMKKHFVLIGSALTAYGLLNYQESEELACVKYT